jgi:hypothetical protein
MIVSHTHSEPQTGTMLDIGGDIGALAIHTPADYDNAEIEISPGTDPTATRSHNQVHPRRCPAGVLYSAVFPSVHEGDHTIWRDAETPEATITIHGGEVTEYHWT